MKARQRHPLPLTARQLDALVKPAPELGVDAGGQAAQEVAGAAALDGAVDARSIRQVLGVP